MKENITIVGAGLTGLMCALTLEQRGYQIDVYERRMPNEICARDYEILGKKSRSLSMDLSARGIHALKSVNAYENIVPKSIPMIHRIIHDEHGKETLLPYGQYNNEYILTVSRMHLYQTLTTRCETSANINIHFGQSFESLNPKNRSVCFINANGTKIERRTKVIIGADGVNSSVRTFITAKYGKQFSISRFPMSYKELKIPLENASGLRVTAMHLWPRKGLMLIAQPNHDLSFTCALLMPRTGSAIAFSEYKSPAKIRQLFDENFPDISQQMASLECDFIDNPIGDLKIVSGKSWILDDFALLLGDAAHSMVPFFGQGVNCSFEDCTFLAECLDRTDNNWFEIFRRFEEERVAEAHAINIMSYENYPELFANNDLQHVQLIREIEALLSAQFRDQYRSYHNLVCFERVPYTRAQRVRTLQLLLLHKLSQNITRVEDINAEELHKAMAEYRAQLAILSAGYQTPEIDSVSNNY